MRGREIKKGTKGKEMGRRGSEGYEKGGGGVIPLVARNKERW